MGIIIIALIMVIIILIMVIIGKVSRMYVLTNTENLLIFWWEWQAMYDKQHK